MIGEGPPLVKTANWLNHIEHDWDSPLWRHWIDEFTQRPFAWSATTSAATACRDWDTPELSFDAFVDDLETRRRLRSSSSSSTCSAISQGAAVAIAYAVRHPERVRRLVICNGYAAGWAVRADPAEVARREAMLTLTEVGWGADNPAYRQLFTNHYIPGASAQADGLVQRDAAAVGVARECGEAAAGACRRSTSGRLLPQVRTPTLIFHSRDDQAVPFAQGEELAGGIPGAAFVPLESRNHILLESEPAWRMFSDVTREFLKG